MRIRDTLPRAACAAATLVLGACADHGSSPSPSSAASDVWRDSFPVAPSSLSPTGDGPYFILHPGYTLIYRSDDGEALTITVLPATQAIDGVTARVVEEREEKNGKLVEISRNYMALDPATGDVNYLGEAVDIYKNGVIAGHEGAWVSGQNGARFGLLVPGHPRVGDRFYQELAPGVAMDRAEVVSIDEEVTVPAGTFAHCLHIKETTPLENGVSHKWYAPGVGLIKDDEAALVEVRRP